MEMKHLSPLTLSMQKKGNDCNWKTLKSKETGAYILGFR